MAIDNILIVHHNRKSHISEAYRSLRTNIIFSKNFKTPMVIAVTSTGPGEGKTTTVANIALAFAQTKYKTIILDADMRRPSIHRLFDLSRLNGMSSLLEQQTDIHDCIQHIDDAGVDIITSGPTSVDPTELLSSKLFGDILSKLKQEYDIILIDTPPVGMVTDASLIAALADGTLFVIKEGAVRGKDFRLAKTNIEMVGSKIIGVAFNMIGISSGNSYYYPFYRYYYNSYYYKYGYNYGEMQDKPGINLQDNKSKKD